MVHDVVISVGVYSVFQFEVTPETVVAFLTILGYSIYDTIVVFDKVKENQARPAIANRLTYTDLTSLSMNQVLMRSINTSIVALLPVISMLVVGAGILGAVTLEQFSIALLVGMLVGRLLVDLRRRARSWCALKEREPRNRALRQRLESGRLAPPTTADIGRRPRARTESRRRGRPVGPTRGRRRPADAGSPADAGARAATPRRRRPPPPTGAIPPRPRKKGKRR